MTPLAQYLLSQEMSQIQPLIQLRIQGLRTQTTTLSEEEIKQIDTLLSNKRTYLMQQLYQRYPGSKKFESSRQLRSQTQQARKVGDLKTVTVRWRTDNAGSSFVPLDGAKRV